MGQQCTKPDDMPVDQAVLEHRLNTAIDQELAAQPWVDNAVVTALVRKDK